MTGARRGRRIRRYNVKVTIFNDDGTKTVEVQMAEDILAILTVFSARSTAPVPKKQTEQSQNSTSLNLIDHCRLPQWRWTLCRLDLPARRPIWSAI